MPDINIFEQAFTSESISLDLLHISVFEQVFVRESISFGSLNINVFDNARTTETITTRVFHNVFIIENVKLKDIINTNGLFIVIEDKIIVTDVINLLHINFDSLNINIDNEYIYITESLFNALKIQVNEDVIVTESVTLGQYQINLNDSIIATDIVQIYVEESLYGIALPLLTPPETPDYAEHLSADLLRGDKYLEDITTFWNQPFPENLRTENGNIARFEKTWSKTHTSLRNRKCTIRLEVSLSDNSIQVIPIGNFLIGTSEQEDNTISLQLEDLTKKLIETPADDIKSGFQWYRNIPLDFLVKELIKKAYPDPRNGEIPRDFIINGIRPPTPKNIPIISSLGRPPTFTRLTNNLNSIGKTHSILAADLGIKGQRLYLGISKFFYEFNELTQTYIQIGEVKSSSSVFSDTVYNIKRLWFNDESVVEDRYIHGVAWPEEELVHDLGEFEDDGITLRRKRYLCPTSSEFLIFRSNGINIEILYDSAIENKTFGLKLFSGEYHIVQPSVAAAQQSLTDYYGSTFNRNVTMQNEWFQFHTEWPKRSIAVGYGSLQKDTLILVNGQSLNIARKAIYLGSNYLLQGYQDPLCIPFAQTVGFSINMIQESLWTQWFEWRIITNPTVFGIQDVKKVQNFGVNRISRHETGYWRFLENTPGVGDKYFTHRTRPRYHIFNSKSIGDTIPYPIDIFEEGFDVNVNSDFIVKTKGEVYNFNPGPQGSGYLDSYPYDLDAGEGNEIFKKDLSGIHYEPHTPTYQHLPYDILSEHHFDPGYFNISFEGFLKNEYDWTFSPIGYLKYTSGQSGSLAYLPKYRNKGGIFLQLQEKYSTLGNTNIRRKTMGFLDISSIVPSIDQLEELQLGCYMFDLETFTLDPIENMNNAVGFNQFLDTRPGGITYQKQITAVTVFDDPTIVSSKIIVASQNYPFKGKNNDIAEAKTFSKGFLDSCIISNTPSVIATPLLRATDGYNGSTRDVIIDLATLTNSTGIKKIAITYYHKLNVLTNDDFENRPIIGACYGLWFHDGLTLVTSPGNIFPENTYYPLNKITQSKTTQSFYCIESMNRTEEIVKVRLREFYFDDNFILTQGSNPYNSSDTTLGFINDAVYGESNQLSNLTLMELDNFEIVYGVSAGYYVNPINKKGSKNHLWKYDKFLGGIIELADLKDLNVWDAISMLAEGFNFITGFDEERFFFIPKALPNEPDMLIDLDLDGVVKASKIRDYKVENIIRTTPYISKKGEVEWEVVVIPNETTANDTDRVQLNVELRVRHDDDLTKSIALRVYNKGLILTSDSEQSRLRFSYLIYNNVIETKLMRDLSAEETVIILPSFYGEDLSNQVKPGDIIALEKTDENIGDTFIITRVIDSVNYDSNEIRIRSPFGESFSAYTPVTIYRGFTNDNQELRNHQWSDSGVTYLVDYGQITWVNSITRAVDVGSIRNLSEGTLIRLGDYDAEFIITKLEERNNVSQWPRVEFIPYQGSQNIDSGPYPALVDNNLIIRGFWTQNYDDLVEVGGSKVFLGFAPGSTGTFWQNFRGEDQINIKCPGLILEADSRAIITVVDSDSIRIFGKSSKDLDDNRFIQPSLHVYMARNYLHYHSKPKLTFKIENLIQAIDKGGYSHVLPIIKLLNASERRLFSVRLVSKKYLTNFWGYYIDCYIMEHNFNLKTFIQDLQIRSIDTY